MFGARRTLQKHPCPPCSPRHQRTDRQSTHGTPWHGAARYMLVVDTVRARGKERFAPARPDPQVHAGWRKGAGWTATRGRRIRAAWWTGLMCSRYGSWGAPGRRRRTVLRGAAGPPDSTLDRSRTDGTLQACSPWAFNGCSYGRRNGKRSPVADNGGAKLALGGPARAVSFAQSNAHINLTSEIDLGDSGGIQTSLIKFLAPFRMVQKCRW